MIPPAHARRLLPLTFVVLTLLAFTPVRWVSWLSGFSTLTQTLVAPISHPMAIVSRWLSRTGGPMRDESEALRALTDEVEAQKVQLFQALAENDRLRLMIKELQRGKALDPELQVLQIVNIPVIGSSGDLADPLLTVRAGRNQGVDTTTIATGYGLQLLGRVVAANDRTATVAPITSKSSQGLAGVIMLDDAGGPGAGLPCTLRAAGDGTLYGDVADKRDPATNAPVEPAIGAEVRLHDPAWPRTAQMLLIGRVESVEPSPKQPLRNVVTVRPTIPRLERVSEVVLRIMPQQPEESLTRGGRP